MRIPLVITVALLAIDTAGCRGSACCPAPQGTIHSATSQGHQAALVFEGMGSYRYEVSTERQAVVSMSVDEKALLELTLAAKSTTEEALRKFMALDGVTRTRTWTDEINGLPARGGSFTVALQGGAVEGEVTFVAYDGRVFQILGFGNRASWGAHLPEVRATTASFRQLTDSDALSVQPRRLRIVRPEATQNLEEFARSYQATISTRRLAILNGLARDEPFRAGRAYKVVQGGTLPETTDGS